MDDLEDQMDQEFLSTPSARRATFSENSFTKSFEISIHALREEGDVQYRGSQTPAERISIHALREEGDALPIRAYVKIWNISIHALREEGDLQRVVDLIQLLKFLSTPSARRATFRPVRRYSQFPISIHALREEGDL